MYRTIFARESFYRLNKMLFRLGASGLGILNYANNKISGEHRFLKQYLKDRPRAVIFDVGANIGDYTAAAFEMSPSVTVYAFEPHPDSWARLEARFDQASFTAINSAASDTECMISLYDYEETGGSPHASTHKEAIELLRRKKSREIRVKAITLDGFAANNGIKNIDLLKIDAEGDELRILKGFHSYLETGKVGAVQFEFNEMNVFSKTFFIDFWDILCGFEIYRLLPYGMIRIEKYEPLYCEIFAYQNIIALKKGP